MKNIRFLKSQAIRWGAKYRYTKIHAHREMEISFLDAAKELEELKREKVRLERENND